MGEFGSIDEVLEFAIDREIESNEFYTYLAKRVENPAMRKVFEDFAKEELGHRIKLELLKAGKMLLSAAKVADLKLADYTAEVTEQANMDYKDILIIAMKKERASFNLYSDLAEAVDEPGQKEMFLLLAKEEARHKLRFELEYDSVVLEDS